MKTNIITLLLASILPVSLLAQPNITTNEFYNTGDVIQMVNCSTAGISAGAPGAGVTWDFSKVNTTGSISTTTVAHNTSPVFLTSNLLITLPNGWQEYVQENNTDSYVNGILNPATGVTTNYYNYDESKRPVKYLTVYVDTYRVVISSNSTVGTGSQSETGDGYGTLILPTGTYNNVLRIKKVRIESDTTGGTTSAINNITSYLWFDTAHTAPLFEIDSVNTLTGSSSNAMYLSGPLAAKNIFIPQSSYRGYLDNNSLLLTGTFEYNVVYEVVLYNIIGTKIFGGDFTAYSNTERFDVNKQISPGMYVVSIAQKDNPDARTVIKVIKR